MSRIKIFVSYAHVDMRWVTKGEPYGLIPWLENHFKRDEVDFWWDKSIPGGSDWESTIFQEIDRAHIVILLLSDDFAGSDYIFDKELPRIESRYRAQELVVFPILVSTMSSRTRKLINWVFSLQIVPSDERGLNVLAGSTSWPDTRGEVLDIIDNIITAYRSGQIATTGYVYSPSVIQVQEFQSRSDLATGIIKNQAPSPAPIKAQSSFSQYHTFLILTGVVVLFLSVGFFVWQGGAKKSIRSEHISSASSMPTLEPSPSAPSRSTVALTQETLAPSSVMTKPSASPSQNELIKERIAKAEAFDVAKNWPACLDVYEGIAEDFPESEIGGNRIALFLSTHQEALNKASESDFEALSGPITKAAKLRIVSAEMFLARHLLHAEPAEPKNAFNWYCDAATQGVAKAMTQVGLMYASGDGVEKDESKALSWFQRASDSGDVLANTCLAECYLHGNGTPKDEAKAVALLQKSVAQGDLRAMDHLGTCYEKGTGIKTNFEEAARLYKLASDGGNFDSLGNLGVMYIKGEGVPKEARTAVDLFQRGANKESSLCMYFLGQCYEGGVGVEMNKLQAASWYSKSAEKGNPNAIDWCRRNGVIPASSTGH
jgi:TPR repeat protein